MAPKEIKARLIEMDAYRLRGKSGQSYSVSFDEGYGGVWFMKLHVVGDPNSRSSVVLGVGKNISNYLIGDGKPNLAKSIRRLHRSAKIAYLDWIEVAEDRRKSGIGRDLMFATLEAIRRWGAKRVYLEVDPMHTDLNVLIRFYQKFGFYEIPVDERWVLMRK